MDIVRAAFRKRAAEYHPDRIGSSSAEVREAAADVFTFLNEVHEQLEDPEVLARSLREIQRKRREGVATSELDVERARVMSRLAEARMRKSNWKAARDLWVQAQELLADEPYYEMQETFCRAVLKEIPYDIAAKTLAEIKLNQGDEKERTSAMERARRQAERRFRGGWLHKLAGNHVTALTWFQQVLEIQADHTEARREIRLNEMREKAEAESRGRGGGLGKLFGWGRKSKK